MACNGHSLECCSSGLSPNSFPMPHLYVDRLLPLLTGDETRILLYAVRHILGSPGQKSRIPLSQYSSGSGLSEAACKSVIKTLCSVGVLFVADENDPFENEGRLYGLRTGESWIAWEQLLARHDDKRSRSSSRTAAARRKQGHVGPGVANLPRKDFTPAQRGTIFLKTNGLCAYCGGGLAIFEFHVEHVVPLERGGTHEDVNLVPACWWCNYAKAALPSAALKAIVLEKGDQIPNSWWLLRHLQEEFGAWQPVFFAEQLIEQAEAHYQTAANAEVGA